MIVTKYISLLETSKLPSRLQVNSYETPFGG